MMPSFRWLVSAEDTAYMAWQCWLFRHSARSRCGVDPTFVLHARERDRDRLFDRMADEGADLHAAPSYRVRPDGIDYAPRNSAGTLLEAAERFGEDYFVLFDPDMLFVTAVEPAPALSADRVTSIPPRHPDVRAALDRGWLAPEQQAWLEADDRVSVGVPYVIPRAAARTLARRWLEMIDREPVFNWAMVMWAFGFACATLGMPYAVTSLADANADAGARVVRPMIHYCYGTALWTKRTYLGDSLQVFHDVAAGPEGTIDGEILRQVGEAARALRGGPEAA